ELSDLLTEATCHLWATTLLNTSFARIFAWIDDPLYPKPPEDIPTLKFVNAGIMIVYKKIASHSKTGTSRVKLEFSMLVEERLPKATFIRFTGNADANPFRPGDPNLDRFFNFMLFLQHLQYQFTKASAYISDWQGVGMRFFLAI
ncbi:hypothetical protein DL96DRAFT_1444822, partial [Flagelloscypha sp. PMI_526]